MSRAVHRHTADPELRKLLRRVLAAGGHIQRTRGGHLSITTPAGKKVTAAATPSCPRGVLNMVAQLRRAGLDLTARPPRRSVRGSARGRR